MAAHLAESIPPEARAWALFSLVVLLLGVVALFTVILWISRQRARRYLNPDSPSRPPVNADPWVESARRLKETPAEPDDSDE